MLSYGASNLSLVITEKGSFAQIDSATAICCLLPWWHKNLSEAIGKFFIDIFSVFFIIKNKIVIVICIKRIITCTQILAHWEGASS